MDEQKTGTRTLAETPSVRFNPDGSIARGLTPPPEVQSTAPGPEEAPQLNIQPVTFDKGTLDEYTKLFSTAPGGPAAVIARELASEISQDHPEYMSYETLRNGTARLFDLDPEARKLSPEQRRLSDADIISLFAVDTEGNPIGPGTFGEGMKREALPQAGALGGFMAGSRVGAAMPIPHPLGKAAAGLVGGVIGAIAGYEGGAAATDALIGPERPILPGQTAAYEAGKTAAGAMAWLPLPFMISKNVSLGTAQYLQNLAARGVGNTPRSVRLAQGIENALGRMGESARAAPGVTLGVEALAGLGATGGAQVAETYAPGDPLARLGAEFTGGIVGQMVGQPTATLVAKIPEMRSIFRNIRETYDAGGMSSVLSPIKNARQTQAVNRIVDILEAEGEDVNAIIERLASNELGSLLVDESGRPIPLTAGAKAGSPALLAIEASLDQLGSALGQNRTASSEAAIKALRNVVLAMAQTGDQAALQTAGDIAESVFSSNLQNRLAEATSNVLAAYQRVGGTDPQTNVQLSETLFDVVQSQMQLARDKERMLWRNVPDIIAATPEEAAAEVPAFIRAWNGFTSGTPEMADEIKSAMPRINQFVRRKTDELGLTPRAAADDAADGADLPELSPLTTRELTDMRSMALDLGRRFEANGERNNARIAFEMADAMLEDLQNASAEGTDWRVAYNMARAYSRSLNDTFTRAFAGEALATQKTGAERVAPELLARRLLQGGNDPTYLRIQQINDIGAFAAREGLPGSQETIGTLRGVTEQILRNARAATFDPNTGRVNPQRLAAWVEQNKDTLSAFPELAKDLADAQTANLILSETTDAARRSQAELMAQLSFYDVMNPVMAENGRRMFGTESPTTAIARALSRGNRTPIRSLNNLLEVVQNAPEDIRPQALTGLKSSILEWATIGAGGSHSGSFSPSTMYNSMFRPLPGSQNRITLTEWMLENGVINQTEVKNLETYLREMVKYEAAEASGTIDGLVEKAGPILDLYISITGSAIGSRIHNAMTGGGGAGSLIAAGRGAETARSIFNNIPAALQTDVMTELMQNPQLLAAMMRKPRNEREALRIGQVVTNLLIDQGFMTPPRRMIPGTSREASEELNAPQIPTGAPAQPQMPTPDARPTVPTNSPAPNKQGSVMPPPPAPTRGGAAAPAPIQRAAAPQAPTPSPSGPVDRARFAAFFPNDTTTDLIRQQAASGGIGSLMGG